MSLVCHIHIYIVAFSIMMLLWYLIYKVCGIWLCMYMIWKSMLQLYYMCFYSILIVLLVLVPQVMRLVECIYTHPWHNNKLAEFYNWDAEFGRNYLSSTMSTSRLVDSEWQTWNPRKGLSALHSSLLGKCGFCLYSAFCYLKFVLM